MAATLPPELWRNIVQYLRGTYKEHELADLWNKTRLVDRAFKAGVEDIFARRHLKYTWVVFGTGKTLLSTQNALHHMTVDND
jgi:hypothetical protein